MKPKPRVMEAERELQAKSGQVGKTLDRLEKLVQTCDEDSGVFDLEEVTRRDRHPLASKR